MIAYDDFSFWYPGKAAAAVSEVSFQVDEGCFALVVGPTGSGKSTLLRAVNGLVPHFTGGHVEGRVRTSGHDPRDRPPREYADVVGLVGQDPLAGFVTDTVEEELAFGLEQLATPPSVMRRRVEEMLDAMGVASLRRRALRTLSGGEQQRVAIGAALVTSPRVLVLDEPTSALDPAAAEEALAAVLRLVHDVGISVVAAEHRLERIVEYADQLVIVDRSRVVDGEPAVMMRSSALAPPVVELGRLLGWDPLALSVRDARRRAGDVRAELERLPADPQPRSGGGDGPGLEARGIVVRYAGHDAVRGVDLVAEPGEIVALMGRNGSGKSSLLWAIHGAGTLTSGEVRAGGARRRSSRGPVGGRAGGRRARAGRGAAGSPVCLVPQQATDLLFHASIRAECQAADLSAGLAAGATWALFRDLAGLASGAGQGPRRVAHVDPSGHPRDLSDGQRLALALAVQLAMDPDVVLLDEPTRGLDYPAKARLAEVLRRLRSEGKVVVVATHDAEFVAGLADRVVLMAEGSVVTDATAAEALTGSMLFAPQVAKVLAPVPLLTVDEVARVIGTMRPAMSAAGEPVVRGG
ncbi:MAG TPA: ATP-binding cassette domain-containing protein [Nocardioidaceae bacterium]